MLARWDRFSGPDGASWSPSCTEDTALYGTQVKVERHQAGPFGMRVDSVPTPVVPPPPSPSVGGQVGAGQQLGWSTGINHPRTHRMPLTGRTLIVPSMGVHPNVGPVGFTARQQRLENGVDDQTRDYLPDPAVIAANFTGGSLGTHNPLLREMNNG